MRPVALQMAAVMGFLVSTLYWLVALVRSMMVVRLLGLPLGLQAGAVEMWLASTTLCQVVLVMTLASALYMQSIRVLFMQVMRLLGMPSSLCGESVVILLVAALLSMVRVAVRMQMATFEMGRLVTTICLQVVPVMRIVSARYMQVLLLLGMPPSSHWELLVVLRVAALPSMAQVAMQIVAVEMRPLVTARHW